MNKYEICVSEFALKNYIKENDIQDKKLFRDGHNDFEYVSWTESDKRISYFDADSDFINSGSKDNWFTYVSEWGIEVNPEEFLIAIGYLPEKEELKTIPPIKAEDIHYICEIDNGDRLCVEVFAGKAYVKVGDIYSGGSRLVELSPEGLIELGSDLVRLGVALRDGTYQE